MDKPQRGALSPHVIKHVADEAKAPLAGIVVDPNGYPGLGLAAYAPG